MEIISFRTPGLGDQTYLVAHEGKAVLVDPQRDIDRFLHSVWAARGTDLLLTVGSTDRPVFGSFQMASSSVFSPAITSILSRIVGGRSIRCTGAVRSSFFAASPAGQWTIHGVLMPPS